MSLPLNKTVATDRTLLVRLFHLDTVTRITATHLDIDYWSEVRRLAQQVDTTSGKTTQELSKQVVGKALAGHYDDQSNEFLNIAQPCDLSTLTNTQDDGLIDFINPVLD